MERLIQANVHGSKRIVLSEQAHGQDLITRNLLDIEIVNASCLQTATFINRLPAHAPIPDIYTEQDQISMMYIHFPIGTGDAYLTDSTWAAQMECYAPYNWNVEKVIDPQRYGVYFKLYPISDYELGPRDKMYLSLTNLVSFGQLDKMVYVAVHFTDVPMMDESLSEIDQSTLSLSADGTDFLAYFKISPLRIIRLECDRTKIALGDKVTLQWAVAGEPKKCVLTPGDIIVDSVGSMEVEVFDDTTFQLYAFDEQEQVSETVTVYVDAAVILSFTCNLPDFKTVYGQPVTLSYEVEHAASVYLNEGIGRVSAKAGSTTVMPSNASTTYALSCMGAKGLIKKELTIILTDLLELLYYAFNRIKRSDGSYSYALQWTVAHCNSILLTTSDGVERSGGNAQGKAQFTYVGATPLTFTLKCTGSSGQTIHRTYSVDG